MKERDSMILYRSFYEAIIELPEANQLEIMKAIFEYGFDGVEPKLSGISKTIWILIKPNMEANRRKWENGCKPKQKQVGSKTEANLEQVESKPEGNVYVDVDVEEDVEEYIDKKPSKKKESKTFVAPTYEEVLAYFVQNGQPEAQARKAFAHYNNHNWIDSQGKKVKNWKQKVQTNWFKDADTPEFNRSIKMSKDQGDVQMNRFIQKGLDTLSGEEIEWIYNWQHRDSSAYMQYPNDILLAGRTSRKTKAQCEAEDRKAGYGY